MRIIAFLAATVGLFAQGDLFEKAPPEIDGPLRERVAAFYQAHVDGKFREAEKYVAAGDSQESFYQMQKQRFDSCKTLRVRYEPGHNEAIVTESCKGKWSIQGNVLNSEMAMSTTWKRVDGNWFWHLKPAERAPSPFGNDFVYNSGEKPGGGAPGPDYVLGAGLPKDMSQAAQALMQSVTTDKLEVRLKSHEPSSDVVTLENKMTGNVTLMVASEGAAAGFTATLDKAVLKPGEKALLRLEMKPRDRSPKPGGTVLVTVEPLGKVIGIPVTFSIAPETDKLLPDSLKKPAK